MFKKGKFGRLDRIASLLTDAHAWSKSELQVRKGMGLFTFSKPALWFEVQRIFEVLVWASCGVKLQYYQSLWELIDQFWNINIRLRGLRV